MQLSARRRLAVSVALAVLAHAVFLDAFILPIILPPNLLWYGGYSSSPVLPLPLPVPRPQQIPPVANYLGYPPIGLGGVGGLGGGLGGVGGIPGGIPGLGRPAIG